MWKKSDAYAELGFKADQVKEFRKVGIFSPENGTSRSNTFTDHDFEVLREIKVFQTFGISASYIKKIQAGEMSLAQACRERTGIMNEKIKRYRNSLDLMELLNVECKTYESFDFVGTYRIIKSIEATGTEFIQYEDLDSYEFTLPYIKNVTCPVCGKHHEIDLEDYITYDWSEPDISDNLMGPDRNVEIDTEDQLSCDHCGCKFHIKGWLREYPLGALDQDETFCTCDYHEEFRI